MNELVAYYRATFPNEAAGMSDDDITNDYKLSAWAGEFKDRDPFKEFPQWAADVQRIEQARRKEGATIWGEFKGALGAGIEQSQALLYGAGALAAQKLGATGIAKNLAGKAQEQEQQAADYYQPAVPSYKDVGGVRDAALYASQQLGNLMPSVAESVAAATAGGIAGSEVPVVGNVVGAIAGVAEKSAAKALLKKAVGKLVRSELEQVAEGTFKGALSAETKTLLRKQIGSIAGAAIGGGAASLQQNAGESYLGLQDLVKSGELSADDAATIALSSGLVKAIPDTVLPAYVGGKLASRLGLNLAKEGAGEKAKNAFYGFLTRFADDAKYAIPGEALGEGFQQFVDVAGQRYAKYHDDHAKLYAPLTDEEKTSIIDNAIAGGLGGAVFGAAGAAVPPSSGRQEAEVKPPAAEQKATVVPPSPPKTDAQNIREALFQDGVPDSELNALADRRVAGEDIADLEAKLAPEALRRYFELYTAKMEAARTAPPKPPEIPTPPIAATPLTPEAATAGLNAVPAEASGPTPFDAYLKTLAGAPPTIGPAPVMPSPPATPTGAGTSATEAAPQSAGVAPPLVPATATPSAPPIVPVKEPIAMAYDGNIKDETDDIPQWYTNPKLVTGDPDKPDSYYEKEYEVASDEFENFLNSWMDQGDNEKYRWIDTEDPKGKELVDYFKDTHRAFPKEVGRKYTALQNRMEEAGRVLYGRTVEKLKGVLKPIGLSESEMERVLEKFGFSFTGGGNLIAQVLTNEHINHSLKLDIKDQIESVAYGLAALREENFDELRDVSGTSVKDAGLAVKAVRDFFAGKGEKLAKVAVKKSIPDKIPSAPTAQPKPAPEVRAETTAAAATNSERERILRMVNTPATAERATESLTRHLAAVKAEEEALRAKAESLENTDRDTVAKLSERWHKNQALQASLEAQLASGKEAGVTPEWVFHEYGSLPQDAEATDDMGFTTKHRPKLPGLFDLADAGGTSIAADWAEALKSAVSDWEQSKPDSAERKAAEYAIGKILAAQSQTKTGRVEGEIVKAKGKDNGKAVSGDKQLQNSSLSSRVSVWLSPEGHVLLLGAYEVTDKKQRDKGPNYQFKFPTDKNGKVGVKREGVSDLLKEGYRPYGSIMLRAPRYRVGESYPSLAAYKAVFDPLKEQRNDAYAASAEVGNAAYGGDGETEIVSAEPSAYDQTAADEEYKKWFANNAALAAQIQTWLDADKTRSVLDALSHFQKSLATSVAGLEDVDAAALSRAIYQEFNSYIKQDNNETSGNETGQGNRAKTGTEAAGENGPAGAGDRGSNRGPEGTAPEASPAPTAPAQAVSGNVGDLDAALAYVDGLLKDKTITENAASDYRADLAAAEDASEFEDTLSAIRWAVEEKINGSPAMRLDPTSIPMADLATGRMQAPEWITDSADAARHNLDRLLPTPLPIIPLDPAAVARDLPDLKTALDRAAAGVEDGPFKSLAEALARNIALTGTTLRFIADPTSNSRGRYVPTTGDLFVNTALHGSEADIHATVLHEALHAYLVRLRDLFQRAPETLNPEERAALDGLTKLMALAKGAGVTWQESDSADVNRQFDEFVAALGNREFQAQMAQVKAPAALGMAEAKNLWDAFKRILARLVAYLTGNTETDALSKALDLVTGLVNGFSADIPPVYSGDGALNMLVRPLGSVRGTDFSVDTSGQHAADATTAASGMVAVMNGLQDVLTRWFSTYDSSGGNRTSTGDPMHTPTTFVKSMIDLIGRKATQAPEAIKSVINQHLASKGLNPVDADLRLDGLEQRSEAPKRARELVVLLQRVQRYIGIKRAKIAREFGPRHLMDRMHQSNTELADVTAHYTDMTVIQREMVKEMRRSLNGTVETGAFAFAQQLGVAKDESKASVQAASKVVQDEIEGFADGLQALSLLGLDFGGLKNGQLSAADVQKAVNASADPALARFQKDPAQLALALQFAKKRTLVMDLLSTRSGDTGIERGALQSIMQMAMSDRADAFEQATEKLGSLPRLGAAGQRILTRLREIKKENAQLRDLVQRYTEADVALLAGERVIQEEIQRYERYLNFEAPSIGNSQFEGYHGETYVVPTSDQQSEEELFASPESKRTVNLGSGGDVRQMYKDAVSIGQWLEAHPKVKGTANGAYLERVADKLLRVQAENDIRGIQHGPDGSLMSWLYSLTTQLEMTGTPTGRAAAQQLRRYQYLYSTHLRSSDIKEFATFDSLLGEAKRVTGVGHNEEFKRQFYDAALGYIGTRQDLNRPGYTLQQSEDAAIKAAKEYLLQNSRLLSNNPKAWDAVERLLRQGARCAEILTGQNSVRTSMGLRVREVLDDGRVIFREAIGSPLFTMSRMVNSDIITLMGNTDVQSAWKSPTNDSSGKTYETLSASVVADLYEKDRAQLIKALALRFSPEMMAKFAEPLTNKTGAANFFGPEIGGVKDRAQRRNVVAAFDAATEAGGDMLVFAETLHRLEGGTPETLPQFVGQTLAVFQKYYNQLQQIAEPSDSAASEPGRAFLDARQGDDFPMEWLSFRAYGKVEHLQYIRTLATQAAYGDGAATLTANLNATAQELTALHEQYSAANALIHKGQSQHNQAMIAEGRQRLEAGGLKHARQNAARNLDVLKRVRENLRVINEQLMSAPVDNRLAAEFFGLMIGGTLQGVTTAAVDTISMSETPFRKFGLNGIGAAFAAGNWKGLGLELLGMLKQVVGQQLRINAEFSRDTEILNLMGGADPEALTRTRGVKSMIERYLEEIGNLTTMQALLSDLRIRPIHGTKELLHGTAQRLIRGAKVVMDTGIGRASDPKQAMTTLRPLAPFNMIQFLMFRAVARTWLSFARNFVKRTAKYLQDHPQHLDDLGFKMDLKAFNYAGGWKWQARAFEYMTAMLEKSGVNIIDSARKLLRGEEPFKMEQLRAIVELAQSEILLDAGLSTRPGWAREGMISKIVMPLIGWALNKPVDVALHVRDAKLVHNFKAFKSAMLALFAGVLPISLFYAWMRNEYEEEVMGKKPNVLPLSGTNLGLALLDNLDRVGTFGMAGNLANSLFNRNTAREFSVDSRVFAVNAFINLVNTAGTYYRQGGTVTYQSVLRPLIQTLGGAGYLQNFDAINNLTGMDNMERRLVQRINVGNLLRVAGRELNLDVRLTRGGASTSMPNPVKPWVGQMVLAAYANDAGSFREAYQKALEAAVREHQGEPGFDPYATVAQYFDSYHPLKAPFKKQPSVADYQRMLSVLGDKAPEVSAAVRNFNLYGAQVPRKRGGSGLTPFNGTQEREAASDLRSTSILGVPRDYRSVTAGFGGGRDFRSLTASF